MNCPACSSPLLPASENSETAACPCGWSGYLDSLAPEEKPVRTRKRPAWPDYEKLVWQWANSYARKCPAADVEDLAAEGRIAYCEALSSWNPSKGMFSTHLVWQIRWRMTRWIDREVRYAREVRAQAEAADLSWTEEGERADVEYRPSFLERLASELGEEANRIVRLLLEGKTLPAKGVRQATREIRTALRELRYA
jgi:RNA polymerase sigma factor (sigma-70 family)